MMIIIIIIIFLWIFQKQNVFFFQNKITIENMFYKKLIFYGYKLN